MNAFVFTSTLKDMLRPVRVIVWVVVAIILALVCLLWKELHGRPLGAEQYGMLVRLVVYRLAGLAAAMFTVSVISQEIEQKTIVYLVTRTVPRNVLVFSRGMAAVVAVTLVSWIPLVGVALAMLGPGFVTEPMFWMDLFIMFLGSAAYCSLFVFITLLLNRAMLVILIFAFVWEAFVPFLKGDMYLLSVNTYMNVLATHPNKAAAAVVTAMQSDSTAVAQWAAWAVLPTVAVGMLLLSGWWFSRFQYLPREDAE